MAYYDRYRGSRRRRQNRIKTVLLVLLLLVVIGLAALFVLQETAIFTHDGFHFPFSRQEDDVIHNPDDGEDIKLEIQDPQPSIPSPDASPRPMRSKSSDSPLRTSAFEVSGSCRISLRRRMPSSAACSVWARISRPGSLVLGIYTSFFVQKSKAVRGRSLAFAQYNRNTGNR